MVVCLIPVSDSWPISTIVYHKCNYEEWVMSLEDTSDLCWCSILFRMHVFSLWQLSATESLISTLYVGSSSSSVWRMEVKNGFCRHVSLQWILYIRAVAVRVKKGGFIIILRMVWDLIRVGKLVMAFTDVALLSFGASFSITFLENCGMGESLRATTSLSICVYIYFFLLTVFLVWMSTVDSVYLV